MASKSYPRAGYNGGFITSAEHERLEYPSKPNALAGHPTDPGPVFADGTGTRIVKVRAGQTAWVRGSVYESGPTDIALPPLAANTSGQPRIDLVVLRLNRSDYSVVETVLTGVPAANPVAPARSLNSGTTGVYDFPLAEVRVNSGVTAIPASAVTTRAWYIGSNGQIRCTPTTRPDHEAGLSAWDTVAGYIVSSGGRWLVAAEDSGASKLTLTGGSAPWLASHNTVWRRNGWVFMQLSARRSVTGMNGGVLYTVATIPPGFRPPEALGVIQTTATVPSGNFVATVAIHPTGQVAVNPFNDITVNRTFVISTVTWPCDG